MRGRARTLMKRSMDMPASKGVKRSVRRPPWAPCHACRTHAIRAAFPAEFPAELPAELPRLRKAPQRSRRGVLQCFMQDLLQGFLLGSLRCWLRTSAVGDCWEQSKRAAPRPRALMTERAAPIFRAAAVSAWLRVRARSRNGAGNGSGLAPDDRAPQGGLGA